MEIKFKKLTKSRGLTIPRDMAAHLDLDAGTAVDLTASADGKLIITTAKILTCGRCEPAELIRFICETAKYFTQTSDQLIRHYTEAIQGGVMK